MRVQPKVQCGKCRATVKRRVITYSHKYALLGIRAKLLYCWECAFEALRTGEGLPRTRGEQLIKENLYKIAG